MIPALGRSRRNMRTGSDACAGEGQGGGWGRGGGGAVRRGWGGGGRGSAVVEGGVLPEDTDDGNHVELPPAQRREIADVDVCVCVCVCVTLCVCVCVCGTHLVLGASRTSAALRRSRR